MTDLQLWLIGIRTAMYFFTSVSLVIAAITIYKPVQPTQNNNKAKAAMLLAFAFIFISLGISAILRSVGNMQWSTWVFDWPITLGMIVTCSLSWRYVIRTSRPVGKLTLNEGEC